MSDNIIVAIIAAAATVGAAVVGAYASSRSKKGQEDKSALTSVEQRVLLWLKNEYKRSPHSSRPMRDIVLETRLDIDTTMTAISSLIAKRLVSSMPIGPDQFAYKLSPAGVERAEYLN